MSEPILDFEIAQHLDFQRDPNRKTSQNHSIPEFVKRDIWTFLSVKKVFLNTSQPRTTSRSMLKNFEVDSLSTWKCLPKPVRNFPEKQLRRKKKVSAENNFFGGETSYHRRQ